MQSRLFIIGKLEKDDNSLHSLAMLKSHFDKLTCHIVQVIIQFGFTASCSSSVGVLILAGFISLLKLNLLIFEQLVF